VLTLFLAVKRQQLRKPSCRLQRENKLQQQHETESAAFATYLDVLGHIHVGRTVCDEEPAALEIDGRRFRPPDGHLATSSNYVQENCLTCQSLANYT